MLLHVLLFLRTTELHVLAILGLRVVLCAAVQNDAWNSVVLVFTLTAEKCCLLELRIIRRWFELVRKWFGLTLELFGPKKTISNDFQTTSNQSALRRQSSKLKHRSTREQPTHLEPTHIPRSTKAPFTPAYYQSTSAVLPVPYIAWHLLF